eukprot:3655118-Pyramimonas_sp.AAC.1
MSAALFEGTTTRHRRCIAIYGLAVDEWANSWGGASWGSWGSSRGHLVHAWALGHVAKAFVLPLGICRGLLDSGEGGS